MGMSKTTAIAMARRAVGQIHRRSNTDYVYYKPYYPNRPDGPSSESQHSDYWKACAARRSSIAWVAIEAMGLAIPDDEDPVYVAIENGCSTVESIVAEVIARYGKGN